MDLADYFLIDSAFIGQSSVLAGGEPQETMMLQLKKLDQPKCRGVSEGLFSSKPVL
ncbi:MAG TPA: hypothetical protein VHP11_04935 [Tepidisphaeraceae bacterium]|nr:hypothetical protein [Tepidisphaeraceae bacterium]